MNQMPTESVPTFIRALQARLRKDLPGLEAQLRMSSRSLRKKTPFEPPQLPKDHRKAGVLALLYPLEDKWHTALMQRPESPFAHSKQISFPGGRYEPSDQELLTTALRETEEEFGIPSADVVALGPLTQLYIPASNFLMQPFVGFLPKRPDFIPEPHEVEEILEVPLAHLQHPATLKYKDIEVRGYTLKEVPYFDVQGRTVWGATAMVLSELLQVVEESL